MNERKQKGDEENALPALAEDHLGATVQVTLKDVLLEKSPEWDQQESPTQRVIGIETRDKDDQRDGGEGGDQEKLRGGEEVVEAKAQLVWSFSVDAMRKDHEGESECDGNREYEFVRANECKDDPLGDQAGDHD